MNNYINSIYQKIAELNPLHAKKIKKNISQFDDLYFERANSFMLKYEGFLETQNKTIDYAIDCYLKMVKDMIGETVSFLRTGKYASTTFEEVNKRVYSNPETMEYFMHGLLMSQFLWKHHYQILDYFVTKLPDYSFGKKNYLEIGAGHGLYLSKALEILDKEAHFSVVDISQTSIELAQKFVNDPRVSYSISDIFNFKDNNRFDFITMGEVLEHVENPLMLLSKLRNMITDEGTVFITTPTNAPTIDHIYLFRNIKEIQDLISQSGFEILSESYFSSEDVSVEKLEEFKVATIYGAFLKSKNKN